MKAKIMSLGQTEFELSNPELLSAETNNLDRDEKKEGKLLSSTLNLYLLASVSITKRVVTACSPSQLICWE